MKAPRKAISSAKAQHRIVQNDPEYDKIDGLRKARQQRFNAKVFAIIGVPALFAYGFGLLLLLVAFFYWMNAKALEAKYDE